jgi:hypothetical protein
MIRVPLKVGKGNEHLKGEQRTLDLHTDSDEAFKLPDLVVRQCCALCVRSVRYVYYRASRSEKQGGIKSMSMEVYKKASERTQTVVQLLLLLIAPL